MVIYTLTDDCGEIKKGSKLLFNKSQQRFECMKDKELFISNFAPYEDLLKIKIHRVLTKKSQSRTIFTIPF